MGSCTVFYLLKEVCVVVRGEVVSVFGGDFVTEESPSGYGGVELLRELVDLFRGDVAYS